MAAISCESFEGGYDRIASGQASPEDIREFDQHRQSCPLCYNFNPEIWKIRTVLTQAPELESSPQFIFNLRRRIHQTEAVPVRSIRTAPLPLGLALSSGFALALFLGITLLRPLGTPTNFTLTPPSALTAETGLQPSPTQTVIATERQAKMVPAQDLLATKDGLVDTAKHRLPEAPGKDQITIPPQDDWWRLNQVSTTAGGP